MLIIINFTWIWHPHLWCAHSMSVVIRSSYNYTDILNVLLVGRQRSMLQILWNVVTYSDKQIIQEKSYFSPILWFYVLCLKVQSEHYYCHFRKHLSSVLYLGFCVQVLSEKNTNLNILKQPLIFFCTHFVH